VMENVLFKISFPAEFHAQTAVEAALKLARKYTGRETIVSFTNAFHGMSLGALAVTGNSTKRGGAGVPLGHAMPMPFDNYLNGRSPDFLLFERLLADSGRGLDEPAAVIVETVQGEGGLNVASVQWLRKLRELTAEFGILLIVDDIQAGCGRTGRFFSFERAQIEPDLVCLSKSIGGMGFPMALLLVRPGIDAWSPGEDNGTFRGNNLAFVAAAEALRRYWDGHAFERELADKEAGIRRALEAIAQAHPAMIRQVRGLGLMQGLEFHAEQDTAAVIQACFERGLVVECCGPRGQVLKLMPALTIEPEVLARALEIIAIAVDLRAAHRPELAELLAPLAAAQGAPA